MHRYKVLEHYIKSRVSSVPISRRHELKTIGTAAAPCFIKRDDELSFGVSGTKYRKYVSLIPHIINKNFRQVAVIGSAHSNNVLSISQLLIENNIQPILFLKQMQAPSKVGNFLLTSLLVPSSQIHWLSHEEWPQAERRAAMHTQSFVVNEGACQPEAFAGAMTLVLDLTMSHQLDSIQHLFMEAGTGLSAIATILACAYLDLPVRMHVVLLADDEEVFMAKMQEFTSFFAEDIGWNYEWQQVIARVKLYRPTTAKSFGATTPAHFKKIKEIAQHEGFLTDPIYSVKLFMEMEKIVVTDKITGGCLVIHSGGGLALMGFQEQLHKVTIS